MRLFLLLSFLFLLSCMQNKQVFICGDRECLNKKEAKKYFEENLIIEIKITKDKEVKSYDLVKMNTNKSDDVTLVKQKASQKELTKSDKLAIKKQLKEKKRAAKLREKIEKSRLKEKKKMEKFNKNEQQKKLRNKNKEQKKLAKLNKKNQKKINLESSKENNKEIVQYDEICSTLNKCEIDEISDYLMKVGKIKDYPDLSSN